MSKPLVGIIMGSESDLDIMSQAATVLKDFSVAHEVRIISTHRSPDMMRDYASHAQAKGLQVIIAGAGGSAHLPGMTAAYSLLPVLAVPIKRPHHDHEALWSNVMMPPGVPLATMPENGAKNAALLAIEILSLNNPELAKKYQIFRDKQRDDVIATDSRVQQNL